MESLQPTPHMSAAFVEEDHLPFLGDILFRLYSPDVIDFLERLSEAHEPIEQVVAQIVTGKMQVAPAAVELMLTCQQEVRFFRVVEDSLGRFEKNESLATKVLSDNTDRDEAARVVIHCMTEALLLIYKEKNREDKCLYRAAIMHYVADFCIRQQDTVNELYLYYADKFRTIYKKFHKED